MMRFIIAFILSFVSIASFAQTQQTLGAPGTRIATKGDMSVDSIFYLPRTLVTSRAPFQSGALRYQASDSALYHWTGNAWRRVSPLIDTGAISTRAWRQKGVDSLVTLISTLGGGTVLSVSAGTGMNFTTITTSGSVNADTNVLATRANRDKLKDSLQANIAGKVNISDTATMLSAYLRKADTTSMLSPYLRKTDTTAMLTPYVRIAGFGLTKGTQALSVDSALIATRARVQKGIDSVASLVTTTDSVVFSTRAWRQKGVDSVAALANTKATATGTTNYVAKFTTTNNLGNSIIYSTNNRVGISNASPSAKLDIVETDSAEALRVDGSSGAAVLLAYGGPIRSVYAAKLAIGNANISVDPPSNGLIVDGNSGFGVMPSEKIDVNGRVRIRTIDSVSSPINMVTVDNNGVVRKAAIPSVGVDTVLVSTRAWRQKAVDSLQVNINAKGSGTVTSVAAGTGMSFTTITSTGSVSADTVALATRAWRQKGIDSLAALEVSIADTATMLSPYNRGSGTLNFVSKYLETGRRLGNSQIFDNGTIVNINSTTTPASIRFNVNGNSNFVGAVSQNPALSSASYYFMGHGDTLRSYWGSRGGFDGGPGRDYTIGVLGSNTFSLYTNATRRINIRASGRILINTETEGSHWLDVNGSARVQDSAAIIGRLRLATIDSSASPINMLWAGNDGVIRKAPTASGGITGSGTTNYLPKFTGTSAIGNSIAFDNGTELLVNTTADSGDYKLQVNGDIYSNYGKYIRGNPSDKNRAISIAGEPFSVSVWLEELGGATAGAPDLFFRSGRGNVANKANVQVGDNMGGFNWGGYVNGSYNSSIDFTTTVTNVDTVNKRADGDLRIFQSYNSALTESVKFVANGGHVEVRGYLKSGKIDSTASAINMLYADANGVIKKTAVPSSGVTMSSSTISAASGWTIGEETAANTSINQVVRTQDPSSNTTIHVNTLLYKTTNTFSTGSWVTIGTVPSGYRPNNVVYFSLPNLVDGASFQATNDTDFTAVAQYSGGTSLRIKANGEIDVYVTTVDASADLSGANYVLIPVVVSYPVLPLLN